MQSPPKTGFGREVNVIVAKCTGNGKEERMGKRSYLMKRIPAGVATSNPMTGQDGGGSYRTGVGIRVRRGKTEPPPRFICRVVLFSLFYGENCTVWKFEKTKQGRMGIPCNPPPPPKTFFLSQSVKLAKCTENGKEKAM